MEKRKFQRYALDVIGTYTRTDETREHACKITEISADGTGIRLSVKDKLRFGQDLTLCVSIPARQAPLSAVMRLRWCKEIYGEAESGFIVGGEISHMDPQFKQVLLEHAQKTAAGVGAPT